jgi:hypothetical protein
LTAKNFADDLRLPVLSTRKRREEGGDAEERKVGSRKFEGVNFVLETFEVER